MINNIGLVSLRSSYLDDEKVYPPLALLYLKSSLEKKLPGIKVGLIDEYDDDISNLQGYDMIGMSVMTPQREESVRLLNQIKSKSPNTGVIIGGPHALHYLEDVKKEPFDYIVTNDGQRSLCKILKDQGDRIESDSMNKEDWGNEPRPDRTSNQAREFLKGYNYKLQGKNATTIMTSTGCPMRCTFCEDAMTNIRWSPLEKICNELDDITDLGYEGLYFFDDLFAIAMPKVEPIVNEVNKRNLIYRCNGQANYFTKWGEDFAKLLSDTGCVEIAFGHETGSQKILDNIDKRTSIEQNYKSIEYAKKHGLHVKSFILLGLPGEDWNTLGQTENFIAYGGMDDFQCAVYYPYKGTQIRDNLGGQDLYFEGEGLGAYGQKGGKTESVVRTNELTSKDLLDFRDYLVERYKPKSHGHFFDTHLKSEVEYD